MKRTYVKLLTVAGLTGCFLFTSCRSAQETTARYEISKVEGNMITIDSTWDANPDKKATTVLKPYKDKVDAMMYEVIGTSEMKMDKGTPESLLSNLVASVLQEAPRKCWANRRIWDWSIWADYVISCLRETSR